MGEAAVVEKSMEADKKLIESLARIIAEADPKFNTPYDDLPYNRQLSCRVMAKYIIEIIRKWKEATK